MNLAFSRWLFDQIHSRNLIYNQCWEDPELDNEVLAINPSDRIAMITSAGCNALDYLLRDPAGIHCVDMNPHQNALLELKLAALQALSYEQFFEMFATGRLKKHARVYERDLRPRLTAAGRAIWDRRIRYFDDCGSGLYFHGTAGIFARTLRGYLHLGRGLKNTLEAFQLIRNLDEQAAFYRERIAPKLWSPFVRFLISRNAVVSMLGVPVEQIRQINRNAIGGFSSFVEQRVEKTLTTIPIGRNYFWRVYMNGCYTRDCCPNYLKAENFEFLRARVSRIKMRTSTLTDFLQTSQERFSIFVLLDHMDWLSAAPHLLEEEWRSIMNAALPCARIIYRSGGMSCDYIPEFAAKRLHFETGRTDALHKRDRVGTYGSFYFATVNS
jgi:S-adenosylmethionine-diacylglycerol 3-amino-3-carboxypropyl transferase